MQEPRTGSTGMVIAMKHGQKLVNVSNHTEVDHV